MMSEVARNWVLWEDEDLLVVNKPAGLPALPDGYDPDAPYLKGELEVVFGPLWVVHRLDRETSGVIVLARNAGAHRDLNTQFEQREVSKIYHALVRGRPEWEVYSVRQPLRANGDRKHRTVVDHKGGKPAETELHTLERFRAFSLVEARPHTGRTHQIRAHLASIGFPIAGDELYRGGPAVTLADIRRKGPGRDREDRIERALLERAGLHAFELHLQHPRTGQRLRFQAPYPADLDATLAALRRWEKI